MHFQIGISLNKKELLDIELHVTNTLGIVGMSGSGKSLTLKAILDLLPASFTLRREVQSDIKLVNGESVSFIPQNPFTSLNPMKKLGKQFFVNEAKAKELFEKVGLEEGLLERFPSQLSGGQLQRAIIAISLSHNPKLLLLDEPTTALDTKSKETVLKIVKDLQKELGFKMIFVSHDILSVSKVCDELIVLKDGKTVEYGSTLELLEAPKSEYTKNLIDSGFKNRQWRK